MIEFILQIKINLVIIIFILSQKLYAIIVLCNLLRDMVNTAVDYYLLYCMMNHDFIRFKLIYYYYINCVII